MPTQGQVLVAAAINTLPQGERADAHCPAASEPMPTPPQALVVAASRTTPTSGRASQCPLRAQCRLKDERVGMKLAGVGCRAWGGGSQVGYKEGGLVLQKPPKPETGRRIQIVCFRKSKLGRNLCLHRLSFMLLRRTPKTLTKNNFEIVTIKSRFGDVC